MQKTLRLLICQDSTRSSSTSEAMKHIELIAANGRLLKYVEDGGTLLVFYHKTNEWNPDERRTRPQLAPYPIILSDDRVTDEEAPITFLQPRHPLLNFPNKITQKGLRWLGAGTRALLPVSVGCTLHSRVVNE